MVHQPEGEYPPSGPNPPSFETGIETIDYNWSPRHIKFWRDDSGAVVDNIKCDGKDFSVIMPFKYDKDSHGEITINTESGSNTVDFEGPPMGINSIGEFVGIDPDSGEWRTCTVPATHYMPLDRNWSVDRNPWHERNLPTFMAFWRFVQQLVHVGRRDV